jgi:cytochrome c oxidase assembly protein subunit 15
MSVPDWPNSYGYNMFAFPFSQWLGPDKGGIFYEHSHRLMGSLVGFLAIAVVVAAWLTQRNRVIRWMAVAVLGAVILQGVLGGLRVVMVNLDLAVIHACFAQAFFCLAALYSMMTSRWWIEPDSRAKFDERGSPLVPVAGAATGIVYLQLIAGALMRHFQAGLAIPDLPLAYGHWLPPISEAGLKAANTMRAWDFDMNPVTLGQIWLHFCHRIGAVLVSIAIMTLVSMVLVRHRYQRKLFVPAVVLIILLITQVTLGVFTVLDRKPADIATLHVACGALVLVTCFVLTTRAVRLYGRFGIHRETRQSHHNGLRPVAE